MAKGNKLSEFEKSDITLKRVGKFPREISKAFGCSKTVICNYLKSPNMYGTRTTTAIQGKNCSGSKKTKLLQHQNYFNL